MIEDQRKELIAALEQFIEETPIRSPSGGVMRWPDGTAVAATVVGAIQALAYLNEHRWSVK